MFKFTKIILKLDERYRTTQTKLETSEQKCDQLTKKSHSNLSCSENDFGQKNIAMAQYQEKHMNIEEKMHQLQNEIEDAKMELNRVSYELFFLHNVKHFE